VVLLWAGLTGSAALSAAAAGGLLRERHECDGLVQPRPPEAAGECLPFYAQREDVVRVLVVAALAVLVLAAAVAAVQRVVGLRPQRGPADVEVSTGSAALAGLLGPLGALALALVTYLGVIDPAGQASQGLPAGGSTSAWPAAWCSRACCCGPSG
jgi:hypothetical protein